MQFTVCEVLPVWPAVSVARCVTVLFVRRGKVFVTEFAVDVDPSMLNVQLRDATPTSSVAVLVNVQVSPLQLFVNVADGGASTGGGGTSENRVWRNRFGVPYVRLLE